MPTKVSQRPEYAVLARLIAQARERAGISQRELARRLGRRPTIISRFENGLQSPDLIELADIAEKTNADLMELVQAWLDQAKIEKGKTVSSD